MKLIFTSHSGPVNIKNKQTNISLLSVLHPPKAPCSDEMWPCRSWCNFTSWSCYRTRSPASCVSWTSNTTKSQQHNWMGSTQWQWTGTCLFDKEIKNNLKKWVCWFWKVQTGQLFSRIRHFLPNHRDTAERRSQSHRSQRSTANLWTSSVWGNLSPGGHSTAPFLGKMLLKSPL